MAPAEVILSSFTGTVYPEERRTRWYRISDFNFFFPAFKFALSHFTKTNRGSKFLALLKNIFPVCMILYFSSLQLQIISLSHKMAKGGGCHA
jgi:hypothetical protein